MSFPRALAALTAAILVTSCGQKEDAPAHPQLPEQPAAEAVDGPRNWPLPDTQTLFAWDTARVNLEIGGAICRVLPAGAARYGRRFEMAPGNGHFLAESGDTALYALPGELTVEFIMTPEEGIGQVFEIGPYRLLQTGGELQLQSPAAGGLRVLRFGELRPGLPAHLWLHLSAKGCAAWMDRSPVPMRQSLLGLETKPAVNAPVELRFGGPWDGRLERLAIYAGLLGEEAMQKSFASADISRPPVGDPQRISARLIEATPTPSVRELNTYNGALVVHLYEAKSPKRLAVAHWALLDRKPVEGLPAAVGESYDLLIEPVSAHPQLERQLKFDDISDFDAPLFYEVSPPRLAEDTQP